MHGVIEGGEGKEVANGLHPFGEDGDGEEGAGEEELGKNEDVGINGDDAFGGGKAADGEAEAHEDDAGEEGKEQHTGKGGDAVDEGEAEEKIAEEHDDDNGKQLEEDAADAFAKDDGAAGDGCGKEAFEDKLAAEIEEEEGDAENGGAKQGETEHAGKDAVYLAELAAFDVLYIGIELYKVIAAVGAEDNGVEDGLQDL